MNIELNNLTWKTVNHPEIKNMEISEFGHLRRNNSKIIRVGTIDNNGYRSIKIGMGTGKSKKFLVHRLVALTFLPECNIEGYIVDHKNEIKMDNHYTNLQFISRKENCKKSAKHRGINTFMNRKLTDKEIKKCRELYAKNVSIWDIWESVLQKKVTYGSVLVMLHGKTYKEVI